MFNRDMVKRTFAITIGIVAVLVISVIVILLSKPKEVADLETEAEIPVKTSIEEETTHEEEETTTVTDSAEPVTNVAPEETETEVPTYSIEEAADYVLNAGLNGEARKEYLGDMYDEVQAYIDATHVPPVQSYVEDSYEAAYSYPSGSGVLTPDAGINYYGGVLETYYDLDMSWNIGVMRSMGFDAENYPYWVRGDGCKMLGGYIMVAADFGYEPRGTFTSTSLGPAIVVDTGGGGWYWHDICTTW